jgi:hypothetical protein
MKEKYLDYSEQDKADLAEFKKVYPTTLTEQELLYNIEVDYEKECAEIQKLADGKQHFTNPVAVTPYLYRAAMIKRYLSIYQVFKVEHPSFGLDSIRDEDRELHSNKVLLRAVTLLADTVGHQIEYTCDNLEKDTQLTMHTLDTYVKLATELETSLNKDINEEHKEFYTDDLFLPDNIETLSEFGDDEEN